MKHYEDMTEIDSFIDEVLNLVSTDDGQERMDLGGVLIERMKPVFTRATKAEAALGEIDAQVKDIEATASAEWVKFIGVRKLGRILDAYYKKAEGAKREPMSEEEERRMIMNFEKYGGNG